MTSQECADNSLDARIDDMLLDAGAAGDADLRAALLSLGSLAALPAPTPSGDLAKLMATAGSADSSPGSSGDTPGDELARRRRRRTIHRPTLLGIAIIAGMGTGIGGVAASSPAPGQSASLSVQGLLADWSPSWSLPAPARAPMTVKPADVDAADVPEQPVQATQPGQPASSTPLPDPSRPYSDGQMSARQQPSAARPGAVPDLSARAAESRGADGKGIAETPGRASAELPAAAGAGQAGPGVPAGPGGNATADESGVAESLVKPLAEAVHPVVGAATGNPAPLESWLQKFQR